MINYAGENLKHSKIILVAFISAFVAFTTAVLGVAGTIIGSVLSSVLYNVLSEVLEEPFTKHAFRRRFEWEIAYVFPLIVIALIQLLLITAFLSEWGYLPATFLNIYLLLQGVADNNLYKILGVSLLVMSAYPLLLKANILKRSHGWIIAFVGIIFLARGFVDADNFITYLYADIFRLFDFPIELIALILIVSVIYKILKSANESRNNSKEIPYKPRKYPIKEDDLEDLQLKEIYSENHDAYRNHNINRMHINNQRKPRKNKTGINESSDDIEFESSEKYM